MIRVPLLVLAVAALAAAGCVEPADETVAPEPGAGCATLYVTTHWEGANDTEALREALTANGYEWRDPAFGDDDTGGELPTGGVLGDMQGVAELDPPGNQAVTGVVSYTPGTSSGEELILSFEEDSPSAQPEAVVRIARDAASIVNETFPEATLDQWIQDAHTTACAAPPQVPQGAEGRPGNLRT